jgi:Mg-chelatase subunit ChlD
MSNKKQIHNLIILDESGSMEIIKEATIRGFHGLADQMISLSKDFPNQEHFISLTTFNGSGIKNYLFTQPIVELFTINEKNYKPDNNTPLYDAICKSVLKLKHELYGIENYTVLVTVITDGMENSSKEFSCKETKLLIENMSASSRWGFGLIGANIDLKETAKSLSIPLIRTIEFESNDESVDKMFKRYGVAQEKLAQSCQNYDDFDDDIPF